MITFEIKKPYLIRWYTTNKVYHNLIFQAFTSWYENTNAKKGKKYYEEYLVNGKLHRDPSQGPASINWYKDGQKCSEEYHLNGKQVSKT